MPVDQVEFATRYLVGKVESKVWFAACATAVDRRA
jgi:hypothetical protein